MYSAYCKAHSIYCRHTQQTQFCYGQPWIVSCLYRSLLTSVCFRCFFCSHIFERKPDVFPWNVGLVSENLFTSTQDVTRVHHCVPETKAQSKQRNMDISQHPQRYVSYPLLARRCSPFRNKNGAGLMKQRNRCIFPHCCWNYGKPSK